jgi:hypothetical protein
LKNKIDLSGPRALELTPHLWKKAGDEGWGSFSIRKKINLTKQVGRACLVVQIVLSV